MCLGQHRSTSAVVCSRACSVGAVMLVCAPPAWRCRRAGTCSSFSFGAPGSGEGSYGTVAAWRSMKRRAKSMWWMRAMNGSRRSGRRRVGGMNTSSQFKVRSPGAIAVDNSTSEAIRRGVMCSSSGGRKGATPEERDLIDVYDPARGTIVHKLQRRYGEQEEELEDISGVAVDASGTLWVYWETEGMIDAFAKEAARKTARSSWRGSRARGARPKSKSTSNARRGAAFAVAPSDEAFYTGYERESVERRMSGRGRTAGRRGCRGRISKAPGTPRTVLREVDHQDTSGVAVDPLERGCLSGQRGQRGCVHARRRTDPAVRRGRAERRAAASRWTRRERTGAGGRAGVGSGRWCSRAKKQAGAPEVDGVSAAEPDARARRGCGRRSTRRAWRRNTCSSTAPATARAARQRAPACRRAIWPRALAIRASASKSPACSPRPPTTTA